MKRMLTVGIIATVFALVIGGGFGTIPVPETNVSPRGTICDDPFCGRV